MRRQNHTPPHVRMNNKLRVGWNFCTYTTRGTYQCSDGIFFLLFQARYKRRYMYPKNCMKPQTKSRTKEQLRPIDQISETSMRDPDTKAFTLSEKLSDYEKTRPRRTQRDTGHSGLFWYSVVYGCSSCIVLRDVTAFFFSLFGFCFR